MYSEWRKNMKKKMKRILAVVVTFVMLLGSLPVYAAGGDAERTGNDESASFWLQEYDLNSGLETDKMVSGRKRVD